MRLRILHLADVRLGASHAYAGERAERRRRDAHESFKFAADYALDPAHAIDAVLVAGDLFDSRRPDADSFSLARGLFARLAAGGVTVIVLPGFHDAVGADGAWRAEKFAGAEVLSGWTPGAPLIKDVRGEPVHFYGVAFRAGRTPAPFGGFSRVDAPGFHVGLLHGMVEDHPEAATRPSAWRIPRAALEASALDYVALGGAHGATEYRFERGAAAYAGPLEGLDFAPGDLGRKSLLVVELGDGGVSFERVPASRGALADEIVDLDAEAIRDADGLKAALLARSGEDVVLRCTLRGVREFLCDFGPLAAELEERFRALTLVDESTFEEGLLVRRLASEGTIRGFFVRRMLKRLTTLREKLPHRRDRALAEREIRVAARALTLGLEQFVEADATVAPPAKKPASAPPSARAEARIARTAPAVAPAPLPAAAPAAADELVIEEGV
jgi:DNA repair protein SbcD/Mre11